MDKFEIIVRLVEDLKKENTVEHNRIHERLDKLHLDYKPKLSKQQLTALVAAFGAMSTAISTIVIKVCS